VKYKQTVKRVFEKYMKTGVMTKKKQLIYKLLPLQPNVKFVNVVLG